MTSLIKYEAARKKGRWRQYRRVRKFHAWAVRGGHTVDVDGSTYHTSYLGWRCFDHVAKIPPELSGCNVALFATRAQARAAMRAGPKKVHPKAMHGKNWVCWPGAFVEKVIVTMRPAP